MPIQDFKDSKFSVKLDLENVCGSFDEITHISFYAEGVENLQNYLDILFNRLYQNPSPPMGYKDPDNWEPRKYGSLVYPHPGVFISHLPDHYSLRIDRELLLDSRVFEHEIVFTQGDGPQKYIWFDHDAENYAQLLVCKISGSESDGREFTIRCKNKDLHQILSDCGVLTKYEKRAMHGKVHRIWPSLD